MIGSSGAEGAPLRRRWRRQIRWHFPQHPSM